jgi:hypothetical protein
MIIEAAVKGEDQLLSCLISKGANMNYVGKNGNTGNLNFIKKEKKN